MDVHQLGHEVGVDRVRRGVEHDLDRARGLDLLGQEVGV